MRYKLWKYTDNYGYPDFALEDTQADVVEKNFWYKQDQSIYEQDQGKLVWKRATHQASVQELAYLGEIVAQTKDMEFIRTGRE